MSVFVKICGLTREEDIQNAAEAGADYVGFVLTEKSRRYVSMARLEILSHFVPKQVSKVGVFVDAPLEYIAESVYRGELNVIQLHGNENAEFAKRVQSLFPHCEIWKAVHLNSREVISQLIEFPVKKLIADSKIGGSGKVCDWSLVREISEKKDIILAGGITPENAIKALVQTRACGLDISTGVEISPGIKSKEKMLNLFKRIKNFRYEQ